MPAVRYLITGGSGYIGGRLTDELSAREETEKIVDVDLRPPPRSWPKHEFV
jgi:nucleoside-diphosphate-sugar epimerase